MGTGGKKKRPALVPDERSLGGALLINSAYHNYHRKLAESYAQRPQSAAGGAVDLASTSSARLSEQRARKRAEADSTMLGHAANLRSMHSRLSQIASRPLPDMPAAGQAPKGTLQRWKEGGDNLGLRPWLPNSPRHPRSSRPGSAPAGSSFTGSARLGSSSGGGTDWQQLKTRQRGKVQPDVQPVQLPISRFYAPGPSLLPSVQARLYRQSILQDTLERKLYKARDIEGLFRQYMEVTPPEHKHLLRKVIDGLRQELHVNANGSVYDHWSVGLTPITS